MEKGKNILRSGIIIVIITALCAVFGISDHLFFSPNNVMNLLSQMCMIALLTTGLVYVMVLGDIDLSVAGTGALAGVLSSFACLWLEARLSGGMSVILALAMQAVVAVMTGLVVGSLIGFFVAYMRISSMICTLAMLNVTRGLAYIMTGGQPVYVLSRGYAFFGGGGLIRTESAANGIIPVMVIFTVLIVIAMHFRLSKSELGRSIYAAGSNRSGAGLAGIHVQRTVVIGHIACSVMASLAGIAYASRMQNGQPGALEGYEVYAIAAAVLGGTSLLVVRC